MRCFAFALTLSACMLTLPALAQNCGDLPVVVDENLKGVLRERARVLSRYLGEAELTGQIELSRKDVFTRYPEARKTRADAYFLYQVCALLSADTKLAPSEKIAEWLRIRRDFEKPVSEISAEGLRRLSVARTNCSNGDFQAGKQILSGLEAEFPSTQVVASAAAQCEEWELSDRQINVSMQVAPGVFIWGEGNTAYLSRFNFYVDDKYCGLLSNVGGVRQKSCDTRSGSRSMRLTDIELYDQGRRLIDRGGSCSGRFKVKPEVDDYGVILCLKKPYFSCTVMPADEIASGFDSSKCNFRSN